MSLPSSNGSVDCGGSLCPHLWHAQACQLAHRVLSCPSLLKALDRGFGLKPKQIAAERHTTVGVWLRWLWRLPRPPPFLRRSLPSSMKTTTDMCAGLWDFTGTSTYGVSFYPPNCAGGKFHDSHCTDEGTSSSIPYNQVTLSKSLTFSESQLS